MGEKSSAGAKILRKLPEHYAPPVGTGLVARRHHRKIEFYALRRVAGNCSFFEKCWFVLFWELKVLN